MMNSKVKNIVKHNVEKSIRNKWFVILNVLMLIIVVVGFNISSISKLFEGENKVIEESDKLIISLDDETSKLKESLKQEFVQAGLSDKIEIIDDTNDGEYSEENISDNFINVVLNKSDSNIIEAKVISKEAIDSEYLDTINIAIKDVRDNIISDEFNIDSENIKLLNSEPSVERIMLSVNENSETDGIYILRNIVNYLIFFILILILSKTANDVAQEKTSKSIEYVLTSISSRDYLLSKVLSIITFYVIQFMFAMVYILIGSGINAIIKMSDFTTQEAYLNNSNLTAIMSLIDTKLILYIVVIFIYSILTIFILNIIQATLSSKTTSISEAGNTTMILMMLNLILYLVSNFMIEPLKTPSLLMYIVSCIPVVSMYFIPPMILIEQATVIQVIIATLVLVFSLPLVLKICAKYFKLGVLNTSTTNKIKKKGFRSNLSEEEIRNRKILRGEYSKIGYTIGMSIIIYIVSSQVLAIISKFLQVPVYNLLNETISLQNISMILDCAATCLGLYIPYVFLKGYKSKEEVEVKKSNISECLVYVLMGIPVLLIIQFVNSIITSGINANYNVVDKLDMLNTASVLNMILFFIRVAIMPAIFEEVYFRKGIVEYSKNYGKVFAVITSSIIFGSIHMNLSQSIFATMLGIVFAIIAIKTNRIFPCILLHLINNGIAALIMIFKDNIMIAGLISFVYFLVGFAGLVLLIICIVFSIKNRIKKKDKLEKSTSFKDNLKNILQMYKYMLTDYTFILTIISIVVLSIQTEKLISII